MNLFRYRPHSPWQLMLRWSWSLVILLALYGGSSASDLNAQQLWITGYYSAQNGNLPISKVPWAKYTHVIHFAASTDGQGHVIMHYLTQAEIDALTRSNPPGTKVLVAIKDNDSDLNAFPNSVSSDAMIATFVANIAEFVNANGYDGIDLDWEKSLGPQNPQNVAQFKKFLKALRAHEGMADKVITMAANPDNAEVAGDGTRPISPTDARVPLDQVNVMCYDFDWGSPYSWYVGALRGGSDAGPYTCDWDIGKFTQAPNSVP